MKSVYHIPNFCINDPFLVKELKEEIDHEPQEINVNFCIINNINKLNLAEII